MAEIARKFVAIVKPQNYGPRLASAIGGLNNRGWPSAPPGVVLHLWPVLGSDSARLVVLLASVLKPVDDTRMRGKFAETLLSRPHTQVHVAGRAAAGAMHQHEGNSRLSQHGIFTGSRLSLDRLRAQWRYWQLLRRLHPDLVIVHAPELLPLTLLWQWLAPGRRFLYDIRENYALNVSTQRVYRGLVRRGLARGLRGVEALAARRAQAVLLAEASYATELPFLAALPAHRVLVLENKYQPFAGEVLPGQPVSLPSPGEPLQLLYTGTISELNGIRETIELTKALQRLRPGGAFLTVIGFCQQPALLEQLESWAARGIPMRLIGGALPVAHAEIVAAIRSSHLGLALYRPHPSTERCRPTKLFEYLAHGLPVLIPDNAVWKKVVVAHDAGLAINMVNKESIDAAGLLAELDARAARPGPAFYRQGLPSDVLWAAEGTKLWLLLDSFV